MHVQKQMPEILVHFVLLCCYYSPGVKCVHSYVMLLLLQILKSRVSLIVLSVFMKVKIVHYLHFQLNLGKYQGEENTLIGSPLPISLRATAEPKAHCFIFISLTHWIPVSTLSPSSCCSTPVFFLQLHSSGLSFVRKWCF